jgi:DNA invertase Pin-like site-specific DNA recombinase
MSVFGYIRVSSEQQNLEQQKHLLLSYAQHQKLLIHKFIEVEASSQKTQKERKIDILLSNLHEGDSLLVSELSRLGRNMLEVLNIINSLAENHINIVFIRQPELSTNGSHGNLLLAIYSYFAQTEREFISARTKQGLAAIKASGRILGRPKGSKNKKGRVLDPFKSQVMEYLQLDLSIASIVKIINSQLPKKLTYCSYIYYIQHDKDLLDALEMRKSKKSPVSADLSC